MQLFFHPNGQKFDGSLFNLRRLQAKAKVQTDVLDELLFAVKWQKNPQERNVQRNKDRVSHACDSDLRIEVVYHPRPGKL